ncbi:MAG: hypothetical protein WKH64_12925 [Chloroflexia bacterium]
MKKSSSAQVFWERRAWLPQPQGWLVGRGAPALGPNRAGRAA